MNQATKVCGIVTTVLFMLACDAIAYKRFHVGNSFTNGLNRCLDSLILAAGYTDDSREAVIAGGWTLDYHWRDNSAAIVEKLSTLGPFHFAILQPHGQLWARPVVVESNAANTIFGVAVEHNPQCTLLVYCTWAASPERLGGVSQWVEAMEEAINGHFEYLLDDVIRQFPDRPVFITPTGPALLALNDSIQAGTVPGITSVQQLYGDRIHLNADGNYLNGCVHFASLYKRSPVGLPHGYDGSGLTAEQAAIFQRTAWDVVRAYPRTTLSGVPRPPKADVTPPPFPTNLHFVDTTSRSITLAWDAYTESAEIAVFVDSLWTGNLVDMVSGTPLATVGRLEPGVANDIMVTVWDSVCNYSTQTFTVVTPRQRGEKLIGWDPTGLARGEHPSLAASFVHEALGDSASITRGGGLTSANHFVSVFTAGGLDQTTLAGALADNDYFTFSVVPAAGRRYTAEHLTFRFFQQHSDGYCSIALMTSKTGFAEGDEIAVMHRYAGGSLLEFDISATSELRDVTDSVEYRLYIWRANNPATVGFGCFGCVDTWDSADDVALGGVIDGSTRGAVVNAATRATPALSLRVLGRAVQVVGTPGGRYSLVVYDASGRTVANASAAMPGRTVTLRKGLNVVHLRGNGLSRTQHVVIE